MLGGASYFATKGVQKVSVRRIIRVVFSGEVPVHNSLTGKEPEVQRGKWHLALTALETLRIVYYLALPFILRPGILHRRRSSFEGFVEWGYPGPVLQQLKQQSRTCCFSGLSKLER